MSFKWKQFFTIEIPFISCNPFHADDGVALWKINIHESYVEILSFNKKEEKEIIEHT